MTKRILEVGCRNVVMLSLSNHLVGRRRSLRTLRETGREGGLTREAEGSPSCTRRDRDVPGATGGVGGFTLIELLVVITIIAILAGLVLGGAKYAWIKGDVSRTKGEIKALETALEDYKADNGVYPKSPTPRPLPGTPSSSGSLLTALVGGPKKYFSFKLNETQTVAGVVCIVDPFGQPYNYYCNPGAADQTNSATFDLWSNGPDGKSATPADQADDIANWQSF